MATAGDRLYQIDVIGACNLACPSCPVGNMPDTKRPRGAMSPELFEKIIRKIKRESPIVRHIALYSWTEPLLHPKIGRLIEIARKYGIGVKLSSNLNNIKRLEEAIRAHVHALRISVSGFTQEHYGRTHRGGDIERVVANMRLLRQFIDKHRSPTRVDVLYHCYADNVDAEYRSMRALSRELDFAFNAVWAYFMPLEKCLSYYREGFSGDDAELHAKLAVSLDEAREISLRHPSADCKLRSEETAINCDGSVQLCCATYDLEHTVAPSFLDVSQEELQKRKYEHPLCGECMEHGLHDTFTYHDIQRWNSIASQRIAPAEVPPEIIPRPARLKRIGKRVGRALRRATARPAADELPFGNPSDQQ